MYFGLGPFGIGLDLGNNPRPQQQNRHFFQQPQQQQQVRPQDIQAYLQFLQERQHQLNDGK